MSLQVAERAEIEQFAAFAGELRIDGKPFNLYPEQLEIVAPYFDGVRETIVIVPKKNGKSTLIAAVIIYHLLSTVDADCIVVAASRDQAEIILNQARKFIHNTPGLQPHLKVLRREINLIGESGRARVLASDEDTADGQLPTLAIVDELHRHKTTELYAVLRLAIGTTGGRMITISTAGAAMDTPLGEKRKAAYETKGFVRDRERRRSFFRAADGSLAFIEWCLNDDDDPDDLDLVKLVNPAPWKTTQMLAEEKATVSPFQWLRFACGIWTEGEEPWIEPAEWDDLPRGYVKEGSRVVLGVKVRLDDSAIVVFGDKAVETHILHGADLSQVENKILALSQDYIVQTVVYDPHAFRRSALFLEERGLDMTEFPVTAERMSQASVTLKRLIETKELRHTGDTDFRAHVLAGTVQEGERGWRLVSDPSRPITALIALAMAAQVAQDMPAPVEAMVGWA